MSDKMIEGAVGRLPDGTVAGHASHGADKSSPPSGDHQAQGAGPENTCMDCKGVNPVWFAPNDLWNTVIGGPGTAGDPGGFYCPNCFIARAERVCADAPVWELKVAGR